MANLAGQSIKGYELLERTGSELSGAVYRAYQSALGREVAVRVISPRYANTAAFIRRFELEAQRVARLEQLHIVPLYDYWRDPSGAYLVTRWMRGGNLQRALQKGALTVERAASLLGQVAAGLAAAHAQGVVHGDLRPSNILLDEEGNGYLADLCLAGMLRDTEGAARQEDVDGGAGDGLAPELRRGEPATPQSDIYALGAVLVQMLATQRQVPSIAAMERLPAHGTGPAGIGEWARNGGAINEEIDRVIQKAMAADPGRRFQNALEMAAAFRAAAHLDGSLGIAAAALTAREEDILERIGDGLSNREIAEELVVEVTTVKWYITQIYRKLGVRSRKQAIARVQETRQGAREEGETGEAIAGEPGPEPANPYKGLRAFDVSDAGDFFGREELVEKLVGRLTPGAQPALPLRGQANAGDGRFLVIAGPSGSGKSSLVKAGLIPALRGGMVPGSDRWFTVQLVPGSRPLDQLEVALARIAADQPANLREHLERDASGLLRVAELILPPTDSELVVVVDQLEELFTLVADEATRVQFLALLATAASDPHSRVRAIFTLRADYYDRPLLYPEFGQLVPGHMETILPLSAAELERAIRRPAERVGVAFEPGLVELIIDDVRDQPGALPLLQYALTELFEEREGRLLTHAAYQRIGGTAGALARRAEELYEEQDSEGQEVLRQLFLRLVLPSDAASTPVARRRVARAELSTLVANPDLLDELADTYAAYRLLTLDYEPESRRPTVEVAHEALFHEWKRLRDWLEDSREDLRLRRQLVQTADEWRGAGEEPSFLLRGRRLGQFEAWSKDTDVALTAGERAFLKASAAQRDERAAAEAARQAREAGLERRARWVLQALVVVLLVAAVFSGWFALEANRQRGEAERNFARSESQRLAAEAESILERGGSVELAALLALQALNTQYTPQADLALQRASAEHVDSVLVPAWPGAGVVHPAGDPRLSPDNRYLRFLRRDPYRGSLSVELWDMQTLEPLWQADVSPFRGLFYAVRDFTADLSAVILPLGENGSELALLDARSGERIRTLTETTPPLVDYELSADGTVLATAVEDGTVQVWDTATGEEIGRFNGDGVFYLAVSPDSRLVAAKASGLTYVWELESGRELYRFAHAEDRSPLQFAAGSSLLMTSTLPALSLWNLDTGEAIEHGIMPHRMIFRARASEPYGLWLSPDGHYYVEPVGPGGSEIAVWEVGSGELLHELAGDTASIPSNFSSDSRWLVTGDCEGTARVWDLASGRERLVLAGHTGYITGTDLSSDDRYLVTTGEDGAVLIWDLQAPLRREDTQLEGVQKALHLSPDGHMALSADLVTGAAILVDAESFEAVHRLDFTPGGVRPAFSSDGAMVVGVKGGETVVVYDVARGELVGAYSNPDGAYRYAAFVPGNHAIFAGGDQAAYLLDAETGVQLRVFVAPDARLYGSYSGLVAVAPNGRYGALHVWTQEPANAVIVWDLQTGAVRYQSTPEAGAAVSSMAFSADSRTFAWGGSDRIAHVVELQSGRQILRLAQLSPILGIAFSSDSRLLLTSSRDDGTTVWELDTGEVVRRFYAGARPAGFASFYEDDAFVLYATEDGVIHRQALVIDGLVETLCSRLDRDLTAEERRIYGVGEAPTCPEGAGA